MPMRDASARPISPPPRTPMAAPTATATPRPAPSRSASPPPTFWSIRATIPARDLLEGAEDAAFVGGFAAAAATARPHRRSRHARHDRSAAAARAVAVGGAGAHRAGARDQPALHRRADAARPARRRRTRRDRRPAGRLRRRPPAQCRANCSTSCTTPTSPTRRCATFCCRKIRRRRAPSPSGSTPRAGTASGIRAATISTPASRCIRAEAARMNAPSPSPATLPPRRLPGPVRAHGDRRRSAGAAAADRSTIALDAFAGLVRGRTQHGNGIIEITSRGSIQVRGLSAAIGSAACRRCGGVAHRGQRRHSRADRSAGRSDATGAGASFGPPCAGTDLLAHCPRKVSVVVDLDGLAADIVLRTVDRVAPARCAWRVTRRRATPLGAVPLGRASRLRVAPVRLARRAGAASRGCATRSRAAAWPRSGRKSRISSIDAPAPAPRPPFEPIGIHRLRRQHAWGSGSPSGMPTPNGFWDLIEAARRAGAAGVRTVAGPCAFVIGLPRETMPALVAEAATFGFIIAPGDPRRRVIACAGAPICARARSPHARWRRPSPTPRGAAGWRHHPSFRLRQRLRPSGASALVVFGRDGRCDVFVDGEFSCTLTADALPAAIAGSARPRRPTRDDRHANICATARRSIERSFAIIRAEADLSRFSARRSRRRGAHDPCLRRGRGGASTSCSAPASSPRRARRSRPARRSSATPRWWRTASRARGCRPATR